MDIYLTNLLKIFNPYFDLNISLITNPYLFNYEGLFLNDTYIFGNYEIEYYNLIKFGDMKIHVINGLFSYLIEQKCLTKRHLQFVDKFYQLCDNIIFKKFVKTFSNDKFNSYLCLKMLS